MDETEAYVAERASECDAAPTGSARWPAALEAARVLAWEWDVVAEQVAFSGDYRAFFGLPAAGANSAHEAALWDSADPADRGALAASLRRALQDAETWQGEFRGLPREGRPTWYVARARVVRDAAGRAVRVQGAIQEVTGFKQTARALLRANAELQAQSRERTSDLYQRVAELTVLFRVGEVCAQAPNEDDLFERVTALLVREFAEKNCGFVLLDEDRNCLRPHASFFLANPAARRASLALEGSIISRVVRTGRAARIGDVRQDPDYLAADGTTLSELCVPLFVRGQVAGVINVERPALDAFSAFEERFLCTVARLAGDAVERLRTVQQLRESEERYRRLFETCPDSIFIVDAGGRLLAANPAAARMHGYSQEELLALRVQELDDPQSAERAPERIRRLLAGEPLQFEVNHRRKDGGLFPVEVVAARMQVGDDFNVIAFNRDITERKAAEQALRTGHRYYNALFEQSAVAVGQLDSRTGRIVRFNKLYCDMLGYAPKELLRLDFQSITHPDDLPADQANMARLRAGAISTFQLEKRLLHREGREVWVRLTVVPLWSEGDPPDFHLAFVEDITQRIQAEKQARELRDALAHAARVGTISELASGLAHELNQPLAALSLYASAGEELLQQADVARATDCLRKIGELACRAGDIVRRMRSFIDARPSQRARVDVNLLVREVLPLLEGNLRHSRVTLDLRLSDELPPVLADGIQIQQVVLNLMRNAIEAMSHPAVVRRQLTLQTEAADGTIRVSVSDTGCGLNPAIAAALFAPFQTTKANGLGLGLAICQTLIHAHGGTIAGGPAPGGGATFSFTLPVAAPGATC